MLRTEATNEGKTERSSMKILERIVDSPIQQVVSIDDTSRALFLEEALQVSVHPDCINN